MRSFTPEMKTTQLNMLNYSLDDVAAVLAQVSGFDSAEDVLEIMAKARKDKVLQAHPYPVWTNKRGMLVTYVPDETKPNGRRQIAAKSQDRLNDKIFEAHEAEEAKSKGEALTMRKLYPQWLEHKASATSEATANRNSKDWKRYYANDPIVDAPMVSLGKNQLEEWVSTLTKEYCMNRTQFGNFSSIIRQMYAYAAEENLIPFNPFDAVHVNWKKLRKPQRKQDEELIFFTDEAERMVSYCWEQYNKNRQRVQIFAPLAIVFAFYTGVRIGELVSLRFTDINTDGITIQRMLDATNHVVPRTKGTDGPETRTVPLTTEALKVIEEVRRKKMEMGLPVNGYIFAFDEDYNGDPMRLMHRIKNTISAYCKELGMVERSMHDIRRTFISKCIEGGMNIKTVMNMVGHRHVKTTEDNYLVDIKRAQERTAELQRAIAYS